jgi:hypothetical protein
VGRMFWAMTIPILDLSLDMLVARMSAFEPGSNRIITSMILHISYSGIALVLGKHFILNANIGTPSTEPYRLPTGFTRQLLKEAALNVPIAISHDTSHACLPDSVHSRTLQCVRGRLIARPTPPGSGRNRHQPRPQRLTRNVICATT